MNQVSKDEVKTNESKQKLSKRDKYKLQLERQRLQKESVKVMRQHKMFTRTK